jgi:ribonucleoside-diphosphate reductase alpha chain
MALIDIAHPDAGAVIDLKRHHNLHTITLSICIPDDFMRALHIRPGRDRRTPFPHAQRLWHLLLKAAFDTGNPGIVFIDQVNRTNNLSQIECLRACNPCAEQFLPDYGACDLGSIDLTRLVRNPYTPLARIDLIALDEIAQIAVRALDNVIDLTHWPLAQQASEARLTRRIGLGFTGLADALIMLGLRYDRQPGRRTAVAITRTLRNAAYRASVDLAIERGPFPLCDATRLVQPPHAASRLPADLKRLIAAHGLRNSHLLAIAPAGTISIAMAGNVSSGVEPVFAPRSVRTIRLPEGRRVERMVDDPAWRLFRKLAPNTHALPPAWCDVSSLQAEDHLRMVAALQPLVDSGISKTLHLQPGASVRDLDRVLRAAWQSGLKGLTVFRPTVGAQTVLCDARFATPQPRT